MICLHYFISFYINTYNFLEDNIYIEHGVLAPSNAALVEKAARIIHDLGGSVASVGQARKLLSL